jgi:periplasmic protein TonB
MGKHFNHSSPGTGCGQSALRWTCCLVISFLLHGLWLWLPRPPEQPAAAGLVPLHISLRPLPEGEKIEGLSDHTAPPAPPSIGESPIAKPQRVPVPARAAEEYEEVEAVTEELPSSAELMDSTPARQMSRHADGPPTSEPEPSSPATASGTPDVSLVEAQLITGSGRPPSYPRMARERGWQGVTTIGVRVGTDGGVEKLWVASSSGYRLLDQAALAAVRHWRFQPAKIGERAVPGEVRVPIIFELREH